MKPTMRFLVLLLLSGAMLSVAANILLADAEWFTPLIVCGGALALATVDAYFRSKENQNE